MATCSGWSRNDFSSSKDYHARTNACPYNFKDFMSKKRFSTITRELRLTNNAPPTYRDRFWEVREIIKSWNDHMADIFVPAWALCLDESMSIWHSMYTCPGWVFCPRKPHPFGNEYHSMCCGESGVMLNVEMVEEKDRPRELGQCEFEDRGGKTVGLLLRMLKKYFSTGRYVILDSGFCVLKGIVELKKEGIYAGALIKKRRYWPSLVPGEEIDSHFESKNVGETDVISGSLSGVEYFIWGMKEPDYVMKIMGTGGALVTDGCKQAKRTWTDGNNSHSANFSYTKPFHWHFHYRHVVDDHNNLRHSLPSIEDTWRTDRWPAQVFAFLLALSEVNAYLVMRHFVWDDEETPTYLNFRRELAWELIENPMLEGEKETATQNVRRLRSTHQLITAPKHANRWDGRGWKKEAKFPYQQFTCKGADGEKCTKRGHKIRTYCSCTPGKWMCKDCHIVHWLNLNNEGL